MQARERYTIFWFRRDLRLQDNFGLHQALLQSENILPLFIFDVGILNKLNDKKDLRVQFIHQSVGQLKKQLQGLKSDLLLFYNKPQAVFKQLHRDFRLKAIYANHDYEPEARTRDQQIQSWAHSKEIEFKTFKDQCLFEKSEILNNSGQPYTVFTPYKNKWLAQLKSSDLKSYDLRPLASHYALLKATPLLQINELGFKASPFIYPAKTVSPQLLRQYDVGRNFPNLKQGTSHIGLHLRFGTISVRKLARLAHKYSKAFLTELIWRDFFMQILWHFPHVVERSFRVELERVKWRENKTDFARWCKGQTGYPFVDAGMRELNQTGHMHNRLRMVTASFLTKHLLIHWSEGERYFASKLLDYDLAANNGNWQWAAGTGCDAAPYFRVFNPEIQAKKFDPDFKYIKKWVPEFGSANYALPMVEHSAARTRCLRAFQVALRSKG